MKSVSGSSSASTGRNAPISSPSGSASTADSAKPATTRYTLMPVSAISSSSMSQECMRSSTDQGPGRNTVSTQPLAETRPQATKGSTRPSAAKAQYWVRDNRPAMAQMPGAGGKTEETGRGAIGPLEGSEVGAVKDNAGSSGGKANQAT